MSEMPNDDLSGAMAFGAILGLAVHTATSTGLLQKWQEELSTNAEPFDESAVIREAIRCGLKMRKQFGPVDNKTADEMARAFGEALLHKPKKQREESRG
jgi:hypothetical protein